MMEKPDVEDADIALTQHELADATRRTTSRSATRKTRAWASCCCCCCSCCCGCGCGPLVLFPFLTPQTHKHTHRTSDNALCHDGQYGRVCSVFACRDSPPSPVGRVGPVGAVRAVRGFSRFLESPQSTATPSEVPWRVWVGSWRVSVRGSCTFA